MNRVGRGLAAGWVACAGLAGAPIHAAEGVHADAMVVVGDGIPEALTPTRGDPVRGREIVGDRHVGLCLLCHTGPFPDDRSQGTIAPDLAGSGARWTEAQLRLRIVDARRLDPATIMPAYHRVAGDARVGAAWIGKPVLDAQQIEDVVAYLATLR